MSHGATSDHYYFYYYYEKLCCNKSARHLSVYDAQWVMKDSKPSKLSSWRRWWLMCRGKQPGGREGGKGRREGRCSDNLYYYHSWVSYGGWEGLQCSSWLPFVLKTASATSTSTNSNRNNNNKSSQTQNHNWTGRQADSLQVGYLPTYLPTPATYHQLLLTCPASPTYQLLL